MKNIIRRGFTLMELMVCIAALSVLTIVGGLGWVVIHFIAKAW